VTDVYRGDVAFLDGRTRIVLTAVMTQANGDVWVEYSSPPRGPRGWMSKREYLARTREVEGEWVRHVSGSRDQPRIAHFVRSGEGSRGALCYQMIVNPQPAPAKLTRCVRCQQRRRCASSPGDKPCPKNNPAIAIYSQTLSSSQS
jgi:hypothetical protein